MVLDLSRSASNSRRRISPRCAPNRPSSSALASGQTRLLGHAASRALSRLLGHGLRHALPHHVLRPKGPSTPLASRWARRLGATALLMACLTSLPQTGVAATCLTSAASLHGWYAMLVAGGNVGVGTAKYQVGAVLFDGIGSVSGSNVYGSAGSRNALTGTYAANADCTLTLDLTVGTASPSTYTVAVQNSGEADGIETDAAAVATITLKPQYATYTPAVVFNSASLNGTYAAACSGPLSASSDVNLATFSFGNVRGTDPYNNDGGVGAANVPYTGSYSVNTDGTFAGTLMVVGTPFNYYGVIGSENAEIEYVYENVAGGVSTNAFASCVGGVAPTAATSVNLAPYYNVSALFTNGTPVTQNGFGAGYAYSANSLGHTVTWNGLSFPLGQPNAPDAVSNVTVTLPAGRYAQLSVLAATSYGPKTGTFVLHYSDGSTGNFTQSFSDWGTPQNFPGDALNDASESIAVATPNRVAPTGTTQSGPWYLYGYTFPAGSFKTLTSVTLPSTANIVVLAADLVPPPACAAAGGICTPPTGATATVYFGAGANYASLTGVTGPVSCSVANFGGVDPNPGVAESCYVQVTQLPAGTASCATENGSCALPAGTSATVFYGAGTSYSYAQGVVGTISCSNIGFDGDPDPGVGKACYR